VQAALAAGSSPSSLLEEGGNRSTKVTGTLATAASLRSRGGGGAGGGGEGLRSRGGMPYLVGAAAVILVSDGGAGAGSLGSAGRN
jgi:hypothetical protein